MSELSELVFSMLDFTNKQAFVHLYYSYTDWREIYNAFKRFDIFCKKVYKFLFQTTNISYAPNMLRKQ